MSSEKPDGRLHLHVVASPMRFKTVRAKFFFEAKSGMHLGTVHMPRGIFSMFIRCLARGGAVIEKEGPFFGGSE